MLTVLKSRVDKLKRKEAWEIRKMMQEIALQKEISKKTNSTTTDGLSRISIV